MKNILNIVMVVLIGLVLFFGLGPVLIADGSFGERMVTLVVVIVLLALILFSWGYFRKK